MPPSVGQLEERLEAVQVSDIYAAPVDIGTPQLILDVTRQLTVEWQSSVKEIPQQLWDICFPAPLEGLWWYKTLEESKLEAQFKFFYGLIKIDECVAGIIPVFLMDLPLDLIAPDFLVPALKLLSKKFHSLEYQRTLFVGSPCADEGTVGLVDGIELKDIAIDLEECLEAFAGSLGAQMVVWKDFLNKDLSALETLRVSKKVFKVVSFPCATIRTTTRDLSGYLKTLSSERRYKLKKKLKKSQSMGRLSVSVIQSPDADQLTEIVDLFSQTYERGKTKFERLGREFFEQIAKYPMSSFLLLRTDEGRLVAFGLNFHFGDKIINKFLGFDYSMDKNWFLYFRLWAATMEWVFSTGAYEYQSGQTGYSGKLDLGNELIPLTNYSKHLNPIMNAVFALLSKTVTWSTLDDDLKLRIKAHPKMQALAYEKANQLIQPVM